MNERSRPESSATFDVHIDELVLHGVDVDRPNGIGEAVRQSLTRLVAERGVPASVASNAGTAGVGGETSVIAENASALTIGARIADVVYRRVK